MGFWNNCKNKLVFYFKKVFCVMVWRDRSRPRLRNDFKMRNIHSKIWTKSHSLPECKRIFSADLINEVGKELF